MKNLALNDIQAGILKPYRKNKDLIKLLFIKFTTNESGRISDWLSNKSILKITSAEDLRVDDYPDTIINCFFSNKGVKKLNSDGYPKLEIEHTNSLFLNGMSDKEHEEELNDTNYMCWDKKYYQSDILLLIINKSTPSGLEEWKKTYFKIRDTLKEYNLGAIIAEEIGKRKYFNGRIVEPFGYREGISQLKLIKNGSEIIPEQASMILDQNGGSFLVFRKLKQDVDTFKREVEGIAKKLTNIDEKDPQYEIELKKNEHFVQGQIMGRYKNGKPIAIANTPKSRRSRIDDFNKYQILMPKYGEFAGKEVGYDYSLSDDKEGTKCPFFAHIRKVNPRNMKEHLAKDLYKVPPVIARRSIPFYEEHEKQGLLFMCFQRDIYHQFFFIQKSWINKSNYGSEVDPIARQKEKENKEKEVKFYFNREWGNKDKTDKTDKLPVTLSQFVTFLGGEYFYAPPMSFFKEPLNNSIVQTMIEEQFSFDRDKYA